jgi:RHS repeat-associated protein
MPGARCGGISLTDINYTGQRLDLSGLLNYNARMYDPTLGRFISADTIIPDRSNPQSRNRYSYVLNNPLKYTDPSGHCYEGSGEEEDCQTAVEMLELHGAYIAGLHLWRLTELTLIWLTILDFQAEAQWTKEQFKAAIGGYTTFYRGGSHDKYAAEQYGHTITLYDNTFASSIQWAKNTIVHELAHQWDAMAKTDRYVDNLSAKFVKATGGENNWCDDLPGRLGVCSPGYIPGDHLNSPLNTTYHIKNSHEDFAESVAATVYGSTNEHYAGSKRDQFVREQFDNYRK